MGLNRLARFDREFFGSDSLMTYIGDGELGGKAAGLVSISDSLHRYYDLAKAPQIEVGIPRMCVITTDLFDKFMERSELRDLALSDLRDDQISLAFQQASLPTELVGDLRALAMKIHQPIAVRSSSLLEDNIREPFAGVYNTKMIPNNQPEPDIRFRKLTEAVKFVYASTFLKGAREYAKAAGKSAAEEKMAVIIQEVVGHRFGNRFYPHISGVARSYNFYPSGHAKPEDGVINLALGLGKTVVDGGKCWIYSPKYPKTNPPYNSIGDLMDQTQTTFWAVNMGGPPVYDPIRETEYLIEGNLREAESDGSLHYVASTYSAQDDKLVAGTAIPGPRILTIAPSLAIRDIPLNDVLVALLDLGEKSLGDEVEIEFAMTLNPDFGLPARFGLLQIRPMYVSLARIEVRQEELSERDVLAASEHVLGNGSSDSIRDVVYVIPGSFDAGRTSRIAGELTVVNRKLVDEGQQYVLFTVGRLGTSDPWLGVPVSWADVAGAKCVVECTMPGINVDLSQGSHFFHNVIGFGVFYFSVLHSGKHLPDFDWLAEQPALYETENIRHIRLERPLSIKVDGRNGRGVIRR